MTLNEAKRLIKEFGVASWFEAGANVLKLGDKLVTPGDTYSRLDRYNKDNALHFCEEEEAVICFCGEIVLDNNGGSIWYNVLLPEQI